jgi:hypothetical protein
MADARRPVPVRRARRVHSSVIGKIEKANRYARERDRIKVEQIAVTFLGDNDTHRVSLTADDWQCNCHYFESWRTCAHILAMQKILGEMLPEAAQTSLFPVATELREERATA